MSSTIVIRLQIVSLITACIVTSVHVVLAMMATESIALKLKQIVLTKIFVMFMLNVFTTQLFVVALACVKTDMRELEEAAT